MPRPPCAVPDDVWQTSALRNELMPVDKLTSALRNELMQSTSCRQAVDKLSTASAHSAALTSGDNRLPCSTR